jgi:2,3-bisphosphoglycerate-independent phosphoglycerate mutase
MDFNFLRELVTPAQTKIVMLIMDGLGGLPLEPGGKTELEAAHTPHLDALAQVSALGLSVPAGPGITVESGPGHLALFGYDPIQYHIGRGVLETIGVGLELGPEDIAARGNYCTVDSSGVVTDRRAGRIANEISYELSRLLSTRIEDIGIEVRTVREHRLAIVLRGPGLSSEVSDSDPQKNGYKPLPIEAITPAGEKTAHILNRFTEHARGVMADYQPAPPANMLLLRGIDHYPDFPQFPDIYGLRAAAIAVHPTYRGIARLVGMQVLPFEGMTLADELAVLESNWDKFDFFYLHIKNTDLAGEDGDFARKVSIIEDVDREIPRLLALKPDVVVVSGDHSTPALLKGHSWHPLPTLIYSRHVRADGISTFGERACARGSLGIMPATHIMPLALANAMRLLKYG